VSLWAVNIDAEHAITSVIYLQNKG